jgi:hypothetical protein
MPLPTIAFGMLLALFCGAIYHFIRGGSTKKMAVFMLLSLAGFWLGDTLAWYLNIPFIQVGVLNAGVGVILSLVLMVIGDLISHLHVQGNENN